MANLIVFIALMAVAGSSQTENSPKSEDRTKSSVEGLPDLLRFTEKDATAVLNHLLRALKADSEADLLALFDARKMPNYPAFRAQIAELFAKFESFDASYHLLQTATEQGKGIILVDFTLDLVPSGNSAPRLRKQTQLRLVVAPDGKAWKIMDLSPRGFFS